MGGVALQVALGEVALAGCEVALADGGPGPSSSAVADVCALPGIPDGRSAAEAALEAISSILCGADGEKAAKETVQMYTAEAATVGEE